MVKSFDLIFKIFIKWIFKIVFQNYYSKLIGGVISAYFKLYFPNCFELFSDLISVLTKHADLILKYFRYYIYSVIVIYAVCFAAVSVIVAINSEDLLFLIEIILFIYRTWTWPVKRVRFMIKYVFILPGKILNGLQKFILNLISSMRP